MNRDAAALTLANDIATITPDQCLLDVTLTVGIVEVTLTVRADVERDRWDRITWRPERVVYAYVDGEEIIPDRSFCSAEWEAMLRKHDRQIEAWVEGWLVRENEDIERERAWEHAG